MKKTDLRVAKTRKAMKCAYTSLALEEDGKRITIRAITERANVGYATFFRHYDSQDDLIVHIMASLMQGLHDALKHYDTAWDEAVALFSYIRKHQDQFRLYTRIPPGHPAQKTIKAAVHKLVTDRYQVRESPQIPYDAAINHVIESFYTFLRWHLSHIDEHTPEFAAGIFMDLVIGSAQATALDLREDWLKQHPFYQLEPQTSPI